MNWATNRYVPPDLTYWQGRADIPPLSCFFQAIQLLDLRKPIPDSPALSFGLLGFCSDEGIKRNLGRPGAIDGPNAIRAVLAKFPSQRQNTCIYDAGDIVYEDENLENAQNDLAEIVAKFLQHHITPIILGGGHEIAWGHYQGIAKRYPHTDLGIINFDAHFDMRPLLPDNKGSSGTPFLQIAQAHEKHKRRFDYNCVGIQRAGNIQSLFDTARQYHTKFILADDLQLDHPEKSSDFIEHILERNQLIYLSLCLDVFAAAYAPGVSAPQSMGVAPWKILPLVRQLAESGKVISYDIAELSPRYDIDQRTAKLAAHFIYEIVHRHLPVKG